MKWKTILLFAILSVNYTIAQSSTDKKELREAEYNETKALIESGKFSFKPDFALPISGPRVNLQTFTRYLEVDNASVDLFFPYFGNSRAFTNYKVPGGGGGISFKGNFKSYEADFDDKKQKITLSTSFSDRAETHRMIVEISRNGSTSVRISSQSRQSIRYTGKIKKLVKQELGK